MFASFTINSLMDVYLYAARIADATYPGMSNLIGWASIYILVVVVMLMIYKFLS